jgi:hypothetical protein
MMMGVKWTCHILVTVMLSLRLHIFRGQKGEDLTSFSQILWGVNYGG